VWPGGSWSRRGRGQLSAAVDGDETIIIRGGLDLSNPEMVAKITDAATHHSGKTTTFNKPVVVEGDLITGSDPARTERPGTAGQRHGKLPRGAHGSDRDR
jgi:hypothetical protein